jgi:hypothetical protein
MNSIILPSTPLSCGWYFPFRFSDQNFLFYDDDDDDDDDDQELLRQQSRISVCNCGSYKPVLEQPVSA